MLARTRASRALLLATAAAFVTVAAPASASTLTADGGGVFTFTGTPGADTLSVEQDVVFGTTYVFRDATGPITASIAGCTASSDKKSVSCTTMPSGVVLRGDPTDALGGNDALAAVSGRRLVGSASVPNPWPSSIPLTLLGGSGADTLTGAASNDVLTGGGGPDVLRPVSGGDQVTGDGCSAIGCEGEDAIDYVGRPTAVNVNLASGTLQDGGTVTGIEDVTGTSQNDTITGSDTPNAIAGGDGNDSLTGLGAADRIDGGAGDDAIDGDSSFDPALVGGDTLSGGDGKDSIVGRGGNDTIDGGVGDDPVLAGSDGNDTVVGGTGNDGLSGGDGNDKLTGADGDDTLSGGNDDDTVLGGAGTDTLTGDNGNDLLDGGVGADAIAGGNQTDTLDYSQDARTTGVTVSLGVAGPVGDPAVDGAETAATVENVVGTAGGDVLTGDGGPNVLTGGTGADTIDGAAGDDTIDGGDGPDKLTGGAGTDAIRGAGGDDTLLAKDAVGERVDCGEGTDSAESDASDTLTSCETVNGVSTVPPTQTAPPDTQTTPPQTGATPMAPSPAPPIVPVTTRPPAIATFSSRGIHVHASFRPGRRSSRLSSLSVTGLPTAARVELSCVAAGRSCAFKHTSTTTKKPTRRLDLASKFKHRRLTVGTKITVRVTVPGLGRLTQTLTVARKKAPRPATICTDAAGQRQSC